MSCFEDRCLILPELLYVDQPDMSGPGRHKKMQTQVRPHESVVFELLTFLIEICDANHLTNARNDVEVMYC